MRQNQTVTLPVRSDKAGDGWYHAQRGGRLHNGIDYVCVPEKPVLSPCNGVVTKHGYAYGDDLSWRYIQITDGDLLHHRLFYVEPLVKVGNTVTTSMVVGNAQDISMRHEGQGMSPHVHYEIMDDEGNYIDPGSIHAPAEV